MAAQGLLPPFSGLWGCRVLIELQRRGIAAACPTRSSLRSSVLSIRSPFKSITYDSMIGSLDAGGPLNARRHVPCKRVCPAPVAWHGAD